MRWPFNRFSMFRTVFIYGATVLLTAVFATVTIVVAIFSKTGDTPHKVARLWARAILTISGIDVAVKGTAHIDLGRSFIVMANHQSNFDIPVLLAHLPLQFRWLAKAELFKIPVFGRAMRGCGYISIDRSDRESAFQSLAKAAATIKDGTSVLVFPEGTRSLDGMIKPFKKGSFVLAVDAGVAILPIVINGTWSIMPKNKLTIRPCQVTLEVLPLLETSGFDRATKDELMEKTRDLLCRRLGEMKGGPACS